jgi:hypothetical protein
MDPETDIFSQSVDKMVDTKVIRVMEKPSSSNLCGATFSLSERKGVELHQGETIIFRIPDRLHNRTLDAVKINHKKDSKYTKSIGSDGWDAEGAYTKVVVFDKNTRKWILLGKKFAEPRSGGGFETEIIHDCIKIGNIKPTYLAVIGAGIGTNGVTSFRELEINVFPESLQTKKELIFTPGTSFVDIDRKKYVPKYGGGLHPNMGIYNDSVPLNHPKLSEINFPVTTEGKGFRLDMNRKGGTGEMHLKIDHPIKLQRLELAIGDTEDYGEKVYKIRASGPETFRRGWAKLDAYITKGNKSVIQLMQNQNVPPRGILKGSPEEIQELEPGDEITIRSNNDASYLMGMRIQ